MVSVSARLTQDTYLHGFNTVVNRPSEQLTARNDPSQERRHALTATYPTHRGALERNRSRTATPCQGYSLCSLLYRFAAHVKRSCALFSRRRFLQSGAQACVSVAIASDAVTVRTRARRANGRGVQGEGAAAVWSCCLMTSICPSLRETRSLRLTRSSRSSVKPKRPVCTSCRA